MYNFGAYYSCVLNKKVISLKKYDILIILVDLMRVHISRFFYYPDPDPRFLKWIRIRQNEVDHIRIRNTELFFTL